MTEFLEQFGVDLAAIVISLSGAITALVTMVKSFKSNDNFRRDVEITQEGIKEGFKVFADKKLEISIGSKLDIKLEEFKNETVKEIKNTLFELRENEKKRLRLEYLNAKILANTRAFDKLSEEEQAELNLLIKELDTNKDNVETIEVQGE